MDSLSCKEGEAGWGRQRGGETDGPLPVSQIFRMHGPIVTEKNKPDSILDLVLSPHLCALLPVLSHADSAPFVKECCLEPEIYRIAHSQALTFKGITLFHSYRDKKLQNRK